MAATGLSAHSFAQSTATIATPAAASSSTPGSASTTSAAPTSTSIHANYTGIFLGPGLNAEAGKTKDGTDLFISNRFAIRSDFTDQINAGLQARLRTVFAKDSIDASNEVWRFFANFRNVAEYDIVSLSLTPRLLLPTSDQAHNNSMTLSPELLASFNVNPKNSRFSFSYTPQMQQLFYTDSSVALKNNAMSFYLVHNLEMNYNLGSTTQITVGYYPEYLSTKKVSFTNSSNEVDVGFNWDFAKGWSINPYLATELNGLDSSDFGKNMQANLTLSGTFL